MAESGLDLRLHIGSEHGSVPTAFDSYPADRGPHPVACEKPKGVVRIFVRSIHSFKNNTANKIIHRASVAHPRGEQAPSSAQ
jgi:hypothetical protein